MGGNRPGVWGVLVVMMIKRHIATLAAIAGCTIGLAVPAMAATAAPAAGSLSTAAAATIPRGLLPMATSWLTPQRGIVLGYPSRTTGAKPYLLVTGNGGRTWQSLAAPPVRYPADNDQPDAIWANGVISVTDGTHIVITRDNGRHWSAERLAGLSGTFYVDGVVIVDGRILARVTTGKSTAVYSGPAKGGVLRAVRGLSIAGSGTYGDISAVGGILQVDLGNDYAAERYWYSRNGVRFVAAPLPCPVTTSALLAGVRDGRVIALCSGSPSDVGLGENDKQVWMAKRLGGTFGPSGPVVDSPNELGFAAASAKDMVFATAFPLAVTFNAGRTWTYELAQPNGAFWTDLSFSSATTGVVVCSTFSDAGKEVDTVYRTTNGGRTWHALSLPS
jgi:photosystem II stability/assembly factor-like uncharacterized protein